MTQPSLFVDGVTAAEADKQRGMGRALAHAEADHADWGALAYAFLARFAAGRASFMAFEVVRAAEACSNVPTVNPKAWGGVFVRAAAAGVIVRDGYAPDPNRHNNPAPRWRSRCYTGRV